MKPNRYPFRLRTAAAVAAALLCTSLLSNSAGAQQPKAEVIEKSIRTRDGWTLPLTYFQSAAGKDAPVVILLHGANGNRLVWGNDKGGFAKSLQGAGYAVATVDLRKHGESQAVGSRRAVGRPGPADFKAMVLYDLEAVKDFLMEEHHAGRLNIRKLGLVAADDMCPVAANWALYDWLKKPYPDAPTLAASTPRGQDVRALVLLSPTEGVPGLTLGTALNELRNPLFNLSVLIAVGTEDREDRNAAKKAFERLVPTGTSEHVFLEQFDRVKARGTELLLARTPIEEKMTTFFDKELRSLNDSWVNRKSVLD